MAIPYNTIKSGFSIDNRITKGPIDFLKRSHYYPDFDFTEVLQEAERVIDLDSTHKVKLKSIDNLVDIVSHFIDLEHVKDISKLHDRSHEHVLNLFIEHINPYSNSVTKSTIDSRINRYIFHTILKFLSVQDLINHSYDYPMDGTLSDILHYLEHGFKYFVKLPMFSYNFKVISFDNFKNLGYTKEDIGKAVINDNKGVPYVTKLGKAIGILYPKLPKSLITYMVEAIKDYHIPYTQEMFIHEGCSREHFRYGYMKGVESDASPIVSKPETMSLIKSCLRGQVKAPEIGITDPVSVNFDTSLSKIGIHPAEAYASGDFSIVYITNKADPFDPEGSVYARCVVTHYQVNHDALNGIKHTISDKPVVNISPIYITNEMNKTLMIEYLDDKYDYLSKRLTTKNNNIIISLMKDYGVSSYSVDKVISRYPRLLAINDKGEILKAKDIYEKSSKDHREINTIAPYLDRNNYYKVPYIHVSDEYNHVLKLNKNNCKSENSENQAYLYIVDDVKYDTDYNRDGSASRYFSDYQGFNIISIPHVMEKCEISSKEYPMGLLSDCVLIKGGVARNARVRLSEVRKLGYYNVNINGVDYLYSVSHRDKTKQVKTIVVIDLYGSKKLLIELKTMHLKLIKYLKKQDAMYTYKGFHYIKHHLSKKEHIGLLNLGFTEER